MKTGIGSSAYFALFDYEKGIKTAKAHGYDCIDFQCFNHEDNELFKLSDSQTEKILIEIKQCADEAGIEFYQSHAPWWHECSLDKIPFYEKAFHGVSLLGCHNMAVHPVVRKMANDESEKRMNEVYEYNLEYFSRLIPCAAEHDVRLCIENLPSVVLGLCRVGHIKKLISQLNHPNIKATLDIGHANVYRDNIKDDIIMLGADLALLHVHDNQPMWNDEHLLPYQGTVNRDDFYEGLAKVGFGGVISLELVTPYRIPDELNERFHLYLADLAKFMAKETEKRAAEK